MKKQHQLIDKNGNILSRSSNHKKIEKLAGDANCETKVIMVMIKDNHEA
jgi:hypothetical protein